MLDHTYAYENCDGLDTDGVMGRQAGQVRNRTQKNFQPATKTNTSDCQALDKIALYVQLKWQLMMAVMNAK